ncbi:MAG: MMPL family transporter [Gemmatimonadaceae bacterium]|nr:MMPL family transporter [Gemmatimonadaceae bacterium]
MGFVQRRLLKFVLWVVRRPRLTLAIAGFALVASVLLAVTRLSISTDTNKLFSSDVPFFRNYLEFIQKFPENEAVYVLVEAKEPDGSPPVRRWTAIADSITQHLQQAPDYVASVDRRVPLDKLGVQGLLFEHQKLLEESFAQIGEFGQLASLWGERNRLMFVLGRTPMQRFLSGMVLRKPDADAVQFQRVLSESWIETISTDGELKIGEHVPDFVELGATDPSRLGYYYVLDESDREKKRHLLMVRVFPKVTYDSLTAVTRTVDAIRSAVDDAARDFPEFQVGITGRPALDADEMRSTDQDTHRAEIVALIVVFIGIAITLRSIWLAVVCELALGAGIGWTFGWATISIGELNLLSIVFVIALIGIGMDYLVQVMTRYRREAQRYARPMAIWARVFRYVSPPIFTACLGAAGAFFVSILTEFRGAADLGVIAGGGLLLCLFAGYTVMPAILVLFPGKLKPLNTSERYSPVETSRRSPVVRMIVPAIWVAAILAGIPFAMKTGFDPNLLDLQAPDTRSVQLVRKVKTWFAVVLSKDLEMLGKVRDAANDLPVVERTESALDANDNYNWLQKRRDQLPKINWTRPTPVLAGDLGAIADKATQLANHIDRAFESTDAALRQDKQQAIKSLRLFAKLLTDVPKEKRDDLAKRLARWQDVFVEQMREMFRQFAPPPLDIAKVPHELRQHFISEDGTYALYIWPTEDLWQRENLVEFVTKVEAAVAGVPGAPPVTGIASNIYHSTGNIERSFYKATLYALGLIFILVYLDLRQIVPTLLAVSVLGLGLPMLVAIMGYFDIDWNFANFFGLPILIGAGHEYGVFMIHRYLEVQHNPRRVWGRWDVSDSALLLCAFITSSSFGFFWLMGHHRGLKSLGLVMALGTVCIYLATVMVLRPILRWRLERVSPSNRPGH